MYSKTKTQHENENKIPGQHGWFWQGAKDSCQHWKTSQVTDNKLKSEFHGLLNPSSKPFSRAGLLSPFTVHPLQQNISGAGQGWRGRLTFHMQAQVFTEKVSCQGLFWKEKWVKCCILSSWRGGMLWRGFAILMGVLLSEMPIANFQLLPSMLSTGSVLQE